MHNPNDDPDVNSGLHDDAQKEMATNPGPSQTDSATGSYTARGGVSKIG